MGALLCLVGLEQYIDLNPWDGLRFGALDPPASGEFRDVKWKGTPMTLVSARTKHCLTRTVNRYLKPTPRVVVRDYQVEPSGLSFNLHNSRATRVTAMEIIWDSNPGDSWRERLALRCSRETSPLRCSSRRT